MVVCNMLLLLSLPSTPNPYITTRLRLVAPPTTHQELLSSLLRLISLLVHHITPLLSHSFVSNLASKPFIAHSLILCVIRDHESIVKVTASLLSDQSSHNAFLHFHLLLHIPGQPQYSWLYSSGWLHRSQLLRQLRVLYWW